MNKSLPELSYQFPKDEVINYAKEIISIPVVDFLKWIDLHGFYTLDSNDMPQISSFEDAFYNIVFKLRNNGDKGFRFIEAPKGEVLRSRIEFKGYAAWQVGLKQ